MKHKLVLAAVCLHISAFLYVAIAAGCVIAALVMEDVGHFEQFFLFFLGGFCMALVFGIEVVAYGIRRRWFWAWVAGLCIFGIYLPSLFFPLGVLGLWGLLDGGSRAVFGVGADRRRFSSAQEID